MGEDHCGLQMFDQRSLGGGGGRKLTESGKQTQRLQANLYLPHTEGGRGLVGVQHEWERTIAAYKCLTRDP